MHTIETVSEFRFVPDGQQSEELEDAILKQYKTKCVGLTPAEAELTYLNKAKWLEMYGVDMHQVFGRDENEYKLGLTPSGILVFEGEQKIGLFYWPKIEKVQFSKKKFTIIVVEDDDRGYKQEHTFIFHLIDEKACKHLWKCAVEYHSFFRLRTAPKPVVGGISGFIRRGSRFRGPQRTEFQTTNQTLSTRRSVQFERRPSQRFSRRASYAIKRKLQEQQKLREQSQPATTTTTTRTTTSTNETSTKPTSDVSEKQAATASAAADTSALITFDTPTPPTSTSAAAAVNPTGLSIKEEAENAQARLKQIEIESDMPPPPPPPSSGFTASSAEKKCHPPQIPPPVPARVQRSSVVTTATATPTARHVHGNCCKQQQTSGGNEHDIKCNLLKAQQISSKKCEQQVETANSCCQTCEKESIKTCSKSIDNDETPLIGSSSVSSTATTAAAACSANNSSNCSNNNNNDENLLDKNEQQMVDDKVKLIDKEFISSLSANVASSTTTASTSKRSSQLILPPLPPPITPTPATGSCAIVTNTNHQTQSAYIKESSFITPTSLISDLTAATITTTTTTTLPLTTTTTTTNQIAGGTSSNKTQQQQQQQPEVIITRTQSIYNDRSATAAILQINQKTTSFASNCSSSNKRMSNASNMCNRPITTEL